MPSPQTGAGNPRLCSARTKESVMANFARYFEAAQSGAIQPQSKTERMEYRADQIADNELRQIAARTAFFPQYEITGPHQPREYIDDRSVTRIGRFGALISD